MTPTRTLADAQVFPVGLGGLPLSLEGRPDEERAIRTIHAALDAGQAPGPRALAAWGRAEGVLGVTSGVNKHRAAAHAA